LARPACHTSRYDYSWPAAPAFTTYPDHTEITPPAGGPVTLYVKTDATTPDAGDDASPFGAITYGSPPCGIHIQHLPSTANKIWSGDLQDRHKFIVQAAGSARLKAALS